DGSHRADDAAAFRHDLHVRFALNPALELADAVARVDGVRVRIDKSGADNRAGRVKLAARRVRAAQIGAAANGDNLVTLNRDRAVLDDADICHVATAPETVRAGAGDKLLC